MDIKEHLEKEKLAAKKVGSALSTIFAVFWMIAGLGLLFSSAWMLGLVFLGGGLYVINRKSSKSE